MSQARGQSSARQAASMPPSMQISCPTRNRARSESRNSKSAATASGVVNSPSGRGRRWMSGTLSRIGEIALEERGHHRSRADAVHRDAGAGPGGGGSRFADPPGHRQLAHLVGERGLGLEEPGGADRVAVEQGLDRGGRDARRHQDGVGDVHRHSRAPGCGERGLEPAEQVDDAQVVEPEDQVRLGKVDPGIGGDGVEPATGGRDQGIGRGGPAGHRSRGRPRPRRPCREGRPPGRASPSTRARPGWRVPSRTGIP